MLFLKITAKPYIRFKCFMHTSHSSRVPKRNAKSRTQFNKIFTASSGIQSEIGFFFFSFKLLCATAFNYARRPAVLPTTAAAPTVHVLERHKGQYYLSFTTESWNYRGPRPLCGHFESHCLKNSIMCSFCTFQPWIQAVHSTCVWGIPIHLPKSH